MSGKLSLRLFLVIPFVIQTFATVGLVGYLSFRNGQKAVNDLANQLEQEVSLRVDQHLDNYLDTPHQINQINADAVELGKLDLQDFKSAGHYFWKQMQVFDVGYIYYVLATGEYAGAGIFLEPKKVIIDELSPNTKGRANTYDTDAQGNRTKLMASYDNYHPQKEAAYTDAVKAGKVVWSKVYQWDNFPEIISLSASDPLYNKNNKLIAVLVSNLRLSQISNFLRQIKISPGGKTFVLERDGSVIASSSGEQPYTLVNGKAKRLNVLNSSDRLIQATGNYLKENFGDFHNIDHSQSLEFMLEGKRQFVRVTPWRDKFGLNWLMVVAVPESDFMEQIHANFRTTIFLCLGALGLAIVVGIFTSRWIAKPIDKLRFSCQAFAKGELDETVVVKGIEELEILGESFNKMAAQLKSYFEELEIRVQSRTNELKEKNDNLTQTLEDLKLTQAQLIQAEKMSSLGQMVAGIAHEINNPVNFISANISHAEQYVQDLLDLIAVYQREYPNSSPKVQAKASEIELDFITEDLPKLINSMNVGTSRISNIVLGLRNFSRYHESDMKPVDIHEGIDNTLMILQHKLKVNSKRREITIIKEYKQLPLVNCYASLLNQVFMNILSNAIDALEDSLVDKKQIRISTEVTDCHTVRISIADNGSGMTQEVQQKIFDPFFTTKPVGSGTGLGLSISYQIVVDKHKGRLTCNSQLGKGTEFVIEIPGLTKTMNNQQSTIKSNQ